MLQGETETNVNPELEALVSANGNLDLALHDIKSGKVEGVSPSIEDRIDLVRTLVGIPLEDLQEAVKKAVMLQLLHVIDYHAVAMAASVSDLEAKDLSLSFSRLLKDLYMYSTPPEDATGIPANGGDLQSLVTVFKRSQTARQNAANN